MWTGEGVKNLIFCGRHKWVALYSTYCAHFRCGFNLCNCVKPLHCITCFGMVFSLFVCFVLLSFLQKCIRGIYVCRDPSLQSELVLTLVQAHLFYSSCFCIFSLFISAAALGVINL